ncbi:FecCD family ABC transporter permease [Pseudoclavibacter helvolus]|uniref:FecCD family ABC transporter permease n=1 Tax=Pseudoclavibacter helvolus TaxID=255205 RepID=UPI003C710528
MIQTAPPEAAAGVAIVRRPRRLRALWFLLAVATLGALIVVSVMIGSRDVSWADAVAALGGSTNGFDEAAVAKRIPRTFLAIAVGAALGVSGAVMQGVTRNPLADPGILGVNMGASLAVVTGIAYFGLTSASSFIWVAISGAAVAAVFVYGVGSLGRGGATPLKLALAGAATSAALASFVTAIILPRGDISQSARSWQIGGVGGGTWESISHVLPFLIVGFLISLASAKGLNSLALGDDLAAGLGERVALTRGTAALGAVVLCGAATAVTGPIAFVGLVVPHKCRLMFGVDHRWVLPFSAVVGASLLTGADVLGRILTRPSEIDVGIITAIIGAPIFIWIVRRSKVRAL